MPTQWFVREDCDSKECDRFIKRYFAVLVYKINFMFITIFAIPFFKY